MTWAVFAGEPWAIKKAVCLHEEDAGILWKHMEYRNGHAEVRRSRRLVLSFVATVVNYEYCFYWHFYQVRIEPCCKLSTPFSCARAHCSCDHVLNVGEAYFFPLTSMPDRLGLVPPSLLDL